MTDMIAELRKAIINPPSVRGIDVIMYLLNRESGDLMSSVLQKLEIDIVVAS
jgi:hypothetical protein